MAKGKLLLGLDIGTSSVKIAELSQTRNTYNLRSFDIVSLPDDAIVDGAILNLSAVTEAIAGSLKRNRIRNKDCAIAISGFSVIVKRIRLPLMTDDELDENLRWEIEQHIPFDYSDVVADRAILGRNQSQGSMDVLLVASKRETINEHIAVTRELGLRVRVVDVASFALQNCFEAMCGGCGDGEVVALVNIGENMTSIVVLDSGVTAFTRDINIGGALISSEIQKQLSITRQEAEAFKVGRIDANLNAVIPSEVDAITRQVSESIGQELKRSLNFFYETSGSSQVHRLVLCGGVAKSSSSVSEIERSTGLKVELANPFNTINFDEKAYSRSLIDGFSAQSCIALGLALRRTVE
ncbi:MAG: type IV pilus assembly protein PilM [Bradymonadales bacterium]